jgi:signal transduction histidine kinase
MVESSGRPISPIDRPPPLAAGGRKQLILITGSLVVAGAAVWSAFVGSSDDVGTQVLRACLVCAWAVAAAVVSLCRPKERLGPVLAWAAAVGAVASLAAAALLAQAHGAVSREWVIDTARLALPVTLALLPAVAMHVLLSLPDGRCRQGWTAVLTGYAVALGVGLLMWIDRPSLPLWPVALEVAIAATFGFVGSNRRYRRAAGVERQRMQWFGWAVAMGAEVVLVLLALQPLVDWPPDTLAVATAASLLVPLALALGSSGHMVGRVDLLFAPTVSIAALSGVIFGSYVLIVLGLGRAPSEAERSLLLVSMAAAAIAALLFVPVRHRLSRFSNRVVYGEREAPDAVLRTFGSRLSRAVPLDELLLQVAESMRETLGLQAAEIWTGSDGRLGRAISVPDRPVIHLSLGPDEETVVSRAGVSGQAWVRVWLPELLRDREAAVVRLAPVSHSGHLLGLIVAVRPEDGELFREEDDRMLAELARQVGLALHNVELDSALQASLDEVRRQSHELQASRARIVAASDASRRRIERDLHDGAQQHLVALAVNLRLARQLAGTDLESATQILDQLAMDLQEAVSELRNLAHGIYPPLLVDRGLVEALSAAAGRAALPTAVHADDLERYSPEVEAAVYFCCLEALQNAGKHAGEAATIRVDVREEAGGLLFAVVDDGRGFDQALRSERGAGFVNMADRVGAIGGSVEIQSTPSRGTRVSGRIPLTR